MIAHTKATILFAAERATNDIAGIVLGYYFGSHSTWGAYAGFALAVASVICTLWRRLLEKEQAERRKVYDEVEQVLRAAGETFAVDDEGRVYISERLRAELAKSQDPAKRHTTQEY